MEMVDGIDAAAAAFTKDLQSEGKPTPAAPAAKTPKPGEVDNEGPAFRMFENIGDLEVDEESPPRGGGDDFEDPPVRTREDPYAELRANLEEQGASEDEIEEAVAAAKKEAGEEEDEPGEEEDEPGEGDDEFLSQKVEVTVDGEPVEVSVKEALDGYIRTETFHRRMNQVEDARKIVMATAQEVVQNYQHASQLVDEIKAHLDALIPPEPNWDEEFRKNPARARELQKYYEGVAKFRGELQQKITDANQKRAESNSTQLKTYVAEESKRFDAANARQWGTDPKRKGRDLQAMRRTALSQGFSEEEIAQVYDSRMLQILLKASRYDRMMAAKPKPVKQAQAKQVPQGNGAARTKKGRRGFTTAMKTLNKTGNVHDAAAVMTEIIGRN